MIGGIINIVIFKSMHSSDWLSVIWRIRNLFLVENGIFYFITKLNSVENGQLGIK